MNGLRPSLQEWIRDIIEESGVRVEIRDVDRLELQSFAFEIVIQELNDCTLCQVGREDVLEVGQDLLRGFARGLVDDRLLVGVRIRQVECLQQLEAECMSVRSSVHAYVG